MASQYKDWSEDQIRAVWAKGRILGNADPNLWRVDVYGSLMYRDHYGNRDSEYGWEIDHIIPQSKGGTDDLSNLQPLQYENNIRKSNNYF